MVSRFESIGCLSERASSFGSSASFPERAEGGVGSPRSYATGGILRKFGHQGRSGSLSSPDSSYSRSGTFVGKLDGGGLGAGVDNGSPNSSTGWMEAVEDMEKVDGEGFSREGCGEGSPRVAGSGRGGNEGKVEETRSGIRRPSTGNK